MLQRFFIIIIILLFKFIAFQNEEDYRYDEEHDSETLTLQGQRGLYIIGKAVVKTSSNSQCKPYEGHIKTYKLPLNSKPCSHSDCGRAVRKAKQLLLNEIPSGCLVKQYGTCSYGPKC